MSLFDGYDAYFDSVYVDGYYARSIDKNSMDIVLDMKEYSVGYHTIAVTIRLYNKSTGQAVYSLNDGQKYVPTYFYTRPSNAVKQHDVYWKNIRYYSGNRYQYDSNTNIYLETKKAKARNWTSKGYMSSGNKWYNFTGLKPGKKYKTRTYYGKSFYYDGKDYFWKSDYSPVRTVKTGQKKLPVKSIKVKAYNVKKHASYSYYTTGYFYRRTYRVKTTYYTYKLRAIVTMKKKPKAKGIMINKYKVKGNKKVYVKNLGSWTTLTKPSKNKYIIYVTSYQNKKYGGWSPQKKKNCRIK